MAKAIALGYDTVTHGTWPGVYGSRGYFTAASNAGADLKSLPSWLTAINKTAAPNSLVYSGITGDKALLVPPALTVRTPGVWYNGNNDIVFDLVVSGTDWHRASFYLVDFDSVLRRGTVTLQDASTLTPLASIAITAAFPNGIWMQFAFTGSVKAVFSKTAANNLPVSGMMFDEYSGNLVSGVPARTPGNFIA